MAKIGSTTVELGDWVRDQADDWEGQVTGIDGEVLTLRMLDGAVREVPVGAARYNSWDPKADPALDRLAAGRG